MGAAARFSRGKPVKTVVDRKLYKLVKCPPRTRISCTSSCSWFWKLVFQVVRWFGFERLGSIHGKPPKCKPPMLGEADFQAEEPKWKPTILGRPPILTSLDCEGGESGWAFWRPPAVTPVSVGLLQTKKKGPCSGVHGPDTSRRKSAPKVGHGSQPSEWLRADKQAIAERALNAQIESIHGRKCQPDAGKHPMP